MAIIANKPLDPKSPYAMPVSLLPKKFADVKTSGLSADVVEQPADGVYNFHLK